MIPPIYVPPPPVAQEKTYSPKDTTVEYFKTEQEAKDFVGKRGGWFIGKNAIGKWTVLYVPKGKE